MLVHRGVTEAASFVESRYKAGVPLELLYLDLLAPAARHLGILWEQDICDFGEVTVGLCNLRQVVRELSPLFLLGSGGFDPRRRALFLTMPGDQHSFGLYLVAEFFRRAGWVVSTGTPNSRHEISQLVGRESFAIVGLSVGCGTRLDTVATCIQAIRHLSRNRAVGVFVGGPAFVETPRYVSVVGADGTAPDASQAVMKAEAFIAGVQDLGL
jgi:methanogenic corrinoid protein MtbC1